MRHRLAILFLAASVSAPIAFAQTPTLPTAPPSGDEASSDLAWSQQLEAKLVAEKFDDLDQIAGDLRRDKTRIRGGDWKLVRFYDALDRPLLDDKDSVDHLEHLRHWMSARPESITARLALAQSLHRWAWVARGNGFANTVTPEMAKLFNERSQESLAVLEGSEKLGTTDPEWFLLMMNAGIALGWDNARMKSIFDRGVAAEPGYFYLYLNYANYLLPKWYGKLGDSAAFAKASADRVGGDEGDILYFRISSVLVKRGDGDFPVDQLDWHRILNGYTALNQAYGTTNAHVNQLAFMAYKFGDREIAQQQFSLIGNRWSFGVWRDKMFFDRIRDWASHRTSWPSNSPATSE
jgi:Domain of unknown function (DUF4034)